MNALPPQDNDGEGDLERDIDTAIEACGGDLRATVRALLLANAFLEFELAKALAKTSSGYARRGVSKRRTAIRDS
jgi:hypothetical protein